jgi:Glycosyl hydrolases family 2, sugar binding domain/Glycosyl hydrolases family 2
MKKLMFLFLVLAACTNQKKDYQEQISLAGEWKFRVDSLGQGIQNKWYNELGKETIKLPGSMAENGKGNEVTLKTNWTGDIIDKSYFTDKKYEKYRQPGNIKIPFWLKPVKYYKGAAWYQKEIDIPAGWKGKHIVLSLERCHWESIVYVNGWLAGSQNSLATPHEYDITELLVPGKNLLSIRIDNRIIIPIGVNSHSISDHTQSNWNGITGNISLKATSPVYISDIKVYPDIHTKMARVVVALDKKPGTPFEGKIVISAESFNSGTSQSFSRKVVKVKTMSGKIQLVVNYSLGRKMRLWSEFNPSLYKLFVTLKDSKGNPIDNKTVDFGMREFKANGTRFEVNGQQVFLRGTLECCIFPLTGYPPTDVNSWEKVLQTCKDYGLNHIRFHSWCPPEAAFIAADKLGIYFHIECSSWANQGTSIGDSLPVDRFIYDESDRILKAYGNHPSFCMLAYGNEPAGKNQKEYLGKLIKYWKSTDNRRVYTSGAGWPIIPENDYNLSSEPRIQHWGEGLKSIINAEPPQTMFDYRDFVSKYNVPTVSHEIGQWCVYPDFKEISKYTGVLKATNFEIFRETLNENNMGSQAEDFLRASGKLQVLCYKADIEAALRTPGFAGFQLLQLHDFPGQGSALVGILNPFFESKGYVTPEEFRMFCNETVPLARMKKEVFTTDEVFKADIEIAHFGAKPMKKAVVLSRIINSKGESVHADSVMLNEIKIGNNFQVSTVLMDLAKIVPPQKLTLEVSIKNTAFKNRWDFWVYPAKQEIDPGKVVITEKLDSKTEDVLKKGGSVLLLTFGKVGKEKGAQVAIGFSSIFWNTAWTHNQPPHTLGILCDPKHPVFREFPTEFHSDLQWWDPVTHSQAMILNKFPAELYPLIQPIDTWFENRRLALAFEGRIGNGKLMVCSIDMKDKIEERPVTKQLLLSMLKYMNSDSFNPQTQVAVNDIALIIK